LIPEEFEYAHKKVLMRLKLIFGLASEVIPIISEKKDII